MKAKIFYFTLQDEQAKKEKLDWFDQYKEKKPKDPTIFKLFNKFANYKEHFIDLLQRVCTVSIEIMAITQQMPTE
jgi:predicted helicase